MLNTCVKCKKYSVKKQISLDGKLMTCPFCGYSQEIKRMPLFIVTGASGVGKSTICAELFQKEKDYIVMESDILWNDSFNFSEIHYIAIVCDEDILYKRMTEYRGYKDQEYVKGSNSFNTWLKENADKTRTNIKLLDNSHLTVDEAAKIVDKWIYEHINK